MTNDKDQILVNQFIEDLDKVSREMQPLDENDNIGYVLVTKLKRVYEVYKDTVLSNNDFDYLIDYYSHLQTKDEENQVVENPIPLFMQLSKHKKMVDTVKVQSDNKEDTEVKNMKITCTYKTYSLEITKEEGSDYFKCILIGDAYSTPRKISNESLEKVLHTYKAHIDSFNTGVLGHLMELTVKCGEKTLDTFKYDSNINKVLGNFFFIVKKGEEGSLDKLMISFQEDVDKDKKEKTKKDNPQFKMQFLSTNGKVITVPCYIKEDGGIQCEPFSESNIIVSMIEDIEEEEILKVTCEQDVWHNREVRNMKNERDLKTLKDKLVVSFQKDVDKESLQSVYTGIYFEYKGLATKVEQLNCVNEDRYSCSDGRLKDSTIPKLYEKFKNKIDS